MRQKERNQLDRQKIKKCTSSDIFQRYIIMNEKRDILKERSINEIYIIQYWTSDKYMEREKKLKKIKTKNSALSKFSIDNIYFPIYL